MLLVFVFTQFFTPISYAFEENDDVSDSQVEETVDYEIDDEENDDVLEVEWDEENSLETDSDKNEDWEDVEDTVEIDSDEVEDWEEIEDTSESDSDEGNIQEDEDVDWEKAEDSSMETDNTEVDEWQEDVENFSVDASEWQSWIEEDSQQGEDSSSLEHSTLPEGGQEDKQNNDEEVRQKTGDIQIESQNNENNDEAETSWIIDSLSEDLKEIADIVRYFFKREWDSRYIKYGIDENNIGTITLKDPKSWASITIMDKNLWAESVGVGTNSYGYYFQWWNNHWVKSVNSSNKTTQKATYKDSYYSHGYDWGWNFIVWGTDYWEDGAHYNNLWWNETKESSRYGACPVGYHTPTMKEWNQLLSIWWKIHTQDTSENNMVLRYSADYSTKNIHTFKWAATQCVQWDTECVDEDKLSTIIEVLSSELKLPLAWSYDENGNFHDGLWVYWTSISKNGNMAWVFDVDAYVWWRVDESLMYRSQWHTIRCFQNLEPYEAPVINEESTHISSEIENSEEQDTSIDTQNEEEIQGTWEIKDHTEVTLPDIEPNPVIQDTTGDLVNEEKEVKKYIITWRNEDGTVRDITTVEYGQMPTYSDVDQPSDARYSYTFAGWDPELKVVDWDADYRATYTYTVNKYTVTWKDENGKVLETDEVEYGSIPTYDGEIPEKQPTDEYTYAFAWWNPEIWIVKWDVTYTATYTQTTNMYTVTWQAENWSILK